MAPGLYNTEKIGRTGTKAVRAGNSRKSPNSIIENIYFPVAAVSYCVIIQSYAVMQKIPRVSQNYGHIFCIDSTFYTDEKLLKD